MAGSIKREFREKFKDIIKRESPSSRREFRERFREVIDACRVRRMESRRDGVSGWRSSLRGFVIVVSQKTFRDLHVIADHSRSMADVDVLLASSCVAIALATNRVYNGNLLHTTHVVDGFVDLMTASISFERGARQPREGDLVEEVARSLRDRGLDRNMFVNELLGGEVWCRAHSRLSSHPATHDSCICDVATGIANKIGCDRVDLSPESFDSFTRLGALWSMDGRRPAEEAPARGSGLGKMVIVDDSGMRGRVVVGEQVEVVGSAGDLVLVRRVGGDEVELFADRLVELEADHD